MLRPHITRTLLGAAMALTAIAAAPVVAANSAAGFVEETNWIVCDGTTQQQNLNHYYFEDANPTWAAEPPIASGLQNSCEFSELPVGEVRRDWGNFHWTFEGEFTGNLDSIRFDLVALPDTTCCGNLGLAVEVDGDLVATTFDDVYPSQRASENRRTRTLTFGVDNLGLVDDADGRGSVVHDVVVHVQGSFNLFDPTVTWLWGTTDAPSRLTFNADMTGVPQPLSNEDA